LGFLRKLSEIFKTISGIKFCGRIYDQPFKRSFTYILILSLIIYAIGVFANLTKIDWFIKHEGMLFVNSLPKFSIKEGKLDVGVQESIKLQDGSKRIMIDTLNSINLSEFKSKNWVIIFRERDITVIKGSYDKVISYDWLMSKVHLKSIDKDYLINLLPILSYLAKKYVIYFYVFGYLFWLLFYKSISVLIFSIIGKVINKIQRSKLEYIQILNISMYAITLPWIIKLVYNIIDFNFSRLGSIIIYWTIASIYMYFIIKDIKKQRELTIKQNNPYNVKITV